MKRFISVLLLCSFLAPNFLVAQDEVFYTDEDDELFNRGKFVGEENRDYLRARQRERTKNWSIALSSIAIGVATLVLVAKNHDGK